MKDLIAASESDTPKEASKEPAPSRPSPSLPPWPLIGAIVLISAAFYKPLSLLWQLARSSDLYSHTLLIPLVTLYLVWDNRHRVQPSRPAPRLALIPAAIGGLSLLAFFGFPAEPTNEAGLENYLAPSIFAYVNFIVAACCLFLGRSAVRTNLFPLVFLIFMTPFPTAMRIGIETFYQYTSAEVAYWFIEWSGVPIFREGLVFHMPTIAMEVAPECSGIRSSMVLFITSLVASYLFLNSKFKRTILVLLVIPLGILRNAVRILILAQLCYQIGPHMINSWFHHSGGPPLFALSLIPLFAVLYFFWRSERKRKADGVGMTNG